MKLQRLLVLPLALAFVLLAGCAERNAEKEYTQILDRELAGGDAKLLADQYQAFVDKYPDTKAATRARERLVTLRSKLEEERKGEQLKGEQEQKERQLKAEQGAKERQLKAEQEEAVKLEKQKEQQAFDDELKRQLESLRSEAQETAKLAAQSAHSGRDFVRINPDGDETFTRGEDGKSWSVKQSYQVRQKGTILGTDYYVIVECTGGVEYDAFSKQFHRSVANAKVVSN